jgi:cysteinyl-tRNA synthetase
MANKYLGDTFDIHGGGVDLIFPHHENEIAQSEALSGKTFARYWLHCEHLLVDGQKMSKSLGNYYTLRDLLQKGFSAESIRYLLLSVPRRKQLNFTLEGLNQAASAIDRLENFRFRVSNTTFPEGSNAAMKAKTAGFADALTQALDDDLNTAQALGVVFELVRDANISIDAGEFRSDDAQAVLQCLDDANAFFDVLSRQPGKATAAAVSAADSDGALSEEKIERMIEARREARGNRNFAMADQIRKDLEAAGVLIEDTKEGVRWRRK